MDVGGGIDVWRSDGERADQMFGRAFLGRHGLFEVGKTLD